jgi:hypothetical protein
MDRYSFTVEVAGISATDENRYEERLYAAGCDDALIAVVDGVVFLDFDREAPSYEKAVESATNDVAEAGGRVIQVKRLSD